MQIQSLTDLTISQLNRAIAIKEEIATLGSELSAVLGKSSTNSVVEKMTGKRAMSAEARAKISAAQKLRWAGRNGNSNGEAPKATRKKMSAQTRAKIRASAKARWAKVRAMGKTKLGA